ncbi:hypothetical protein MTR67_035378 [Solanum verrucosum]|uniref:Uncharacterized protein n=1 Tax=Solanum verrucosum TaxID=315347 RepID=A0AAF0U9E9_SOLVR|nr:hypothetical protein MTR67_035378 [Solanum verrucosum]
MRNYGYELLNSRTQRYFSSPSCSTYRDLELEDTTSLQDTQFIKFMRNLWALMTRLEGLHNNMGLVYTNLLILILTSLNLNSKSIVDLKGFTI